LFKFRKIEAGDFYVHAATPKPPVTYMKRYVTEGVTPANQYGLNMYITGSIRVDCPEMALLHTFSAGDTSLDLGNITFIKDAVITETPITEECLRYCAEPKDKAAPWTRRVLTVPVGGVLEVVAGELVIVLRGEVASSAAQHAPGGLIVVSRAQSLTSTAGARLAILKLIPTTLPT